MVCILNDSFKYLLLLLLFNPVPLVDCVITYNELHRLMEQRNYPFDGIKCISLKDEHDIILGKEA